MVLIKQELQQSVRVGSLASFQVTLLVPGRMAATQPNTLEKATGYTSWKFKLFILRHAGFNRVSTVESLK